MSSPTRPDSAKPLCAEMSRAHAESLHATASRVDTWILIEYRGLWAHDAVDGSTLSGALKAHLVAERVRLPHARILFVRRSERRSGDGLLAFFARSTPSERELRCIELERHDDLIGLDLATAGRPSTIRSSSSARTASTTAAAPSSAGRSTTRCASRSRTAGSGSRRTSAATASPATSSSSTTASTTGASSRRTPGPWSRPRSSAASTSRSTAAAPATASPRRRPRSRCARRPRCSASTTFSVRSIAA